MSPLTYERTCVVHGDFHVANLIFHHSEPRVVGMVDWELSTLGDALADFTYHLMLWRLPRQAYHYGLQDITRSEFGIPEEADYVEQYRRRVPYTTSSPTPFHFAFNMFRIAAILHGVACRDAQRGASDESTRATVSSSCAVAQIALQTLRA